MNTYADKTQENKSKSVANSVAQKKSNVKQGFGFVDNRTELVAQRKLQEMTNNFSQTRHPVQLQSMTDSNSAESECVQFKRDGKFSEVEVKQNELKVVSNKVNDDDKTKAESKVDDTYNDAYRAGSDFKAPFREKGDDSTIKGYWLRVYEDARQDQQRANKNGSSSNSSQVVKAGHSERTKSSTITLVEKLAEQYAKDRATEAQKHNRQVQGEIMQLKENI